LIKEANIQMKNLNIEAEKGFRRTLFEPELVDPNMEINFGNRPKGKTSRLRLQLWVNSLEREIF